MNEEITETTLGVTLVGDELELVEIHGSHAVGAEIASSIGTVEGNIIRGED